MDNQSMSPLPPGVQPESKGIRFSQAVEELISGKYITRIAWNNQNTYSLLKDGFLMICIEGVFHTWTVMDVDLTATDWKVISQAN